MSRKPESQFISGVHKYIPSRVYRMKNHNAYVGGIADCWYSGRSSDLWVEYKYLPVTKPIALVVPTLSAQQLMWIRKRQEEGRHVWVIVGYKKGGVIFYDIDEMEYGITAKLFIERTLTRKQLGEKIYTFCYLGANNATKKYTT
jgi:hypothetical protein